jgi:hypothetical protein
MKMEFTEVKKTPDFELKLSLEEAISLWRIVDKSFLDGNKSAEPFVDALYEFASNSNRYTEYLK